MPEPVAGFIFGCTRDTLSECMKRSLFGSPYGKTTSRMVDLVQPGALLFLFNYDTRELYAGFQAAGAARLNIVTGAFGGRFPVQVQFQCFPTERPFLPETEFGPILTDNYFSPRKFSHLLSRRQVEGLMHCFNPSMQQSIPFTRGRPPRGLHPRRSFNRNRFRRRAPAVHPRPLFNFGQVSLEELLELPPYLRSGPLYRKQETAIPIPVPPDPSDLRTTLCFGPLPEAKEMSAGVLVHGLLEPRCSDKYNFVLVDSYNRERWCYINFVHATYAREFTTEFNGWSLRHLSEGRLYADTPIHVMYWKWQGIEVLNQIFTEAERSDYGLQSSTVVRESCPVFFHTATAMT